MKQINNILLLVIFLSVLTPISFAQEENASGEANYAEANEEEIENAKPSEELLANISRAAERISTGTATEEDLALIEEYDVEITFSESSAIEESTILSEKISSNNLETKLKLITVFVVLNFFVVLFLIIYLLKERDK